MATRIQRADPLVAWVARPVGALTAVALLFAAYYAVIHPWFMSWGATPAEQRMPLPGDHGLVDPNTAFTRGITIHAPSPVVWAWVIQIGQDRGGFYSNTWLENIGGNDIHNADAIHPEWQQRAIGDRVPMTRAEFHQIVGDAMYLTIDVLEPGRTVGPLPGRFVLLPIDDQTTRLLLREERPVGIVDRLISSLDFDPMHFVMEQRMLRGIKERAEGEPLVPSPLAIAARIGWLVAAIGVFAAFLARKRHRALLLLPVAAAVPSVGLAHDGDAALAAFLISGLMVLAGRAFGPRWWPALVLLEIAALLNTMVAAVGVTLFGALVWGRRWPVFLLVAAGVLLVFLFSPDAYTAFGLIFLLVAVTPAASSWIWEERAAPYTHLNVREAAT